MAMMRLFFLLPTCSSLFWKLSLSIVLRKMILHVFSWALCLSLWLSLCLCLSLYLCVWVCIWDCLCVFMCACVCVFVCVCMGVIACLCTYECFCVSACMCVCMCVCVCVCVCVCFPGLKKIPKVVNLSRSLEKEDEGEKRVKNHVIWVNPTLRSAT